MQILAARAESAPAIPLDPSAHKVGGALRRWLKRLTREIAIQRQRQVLNQMPDWMLQDVGINRCDIDSISIHIIDGRPDPTRLPRGSARPVEEGR